MIVLTFACSLWLVKIWWVRGLLLLMLAILLTFMLRLPVIDLSQQNSADCALNSPIAFKPQLGDKRRHPGSLLR